MATTQWTVTGWPDDGRDAGLDAGLPAFRLILEERLLLREAEGDDGAIDGDRAALDDQRLGRWMGAEPFDDRRPGGQQLIERAVAGRAVEAPGVSGRRCRRLARLVRRSGRAGPRPACAGVAGAGSAADRGAGVVESERSGAGVGVAAPGLMRPGGGRRARSGLRSREAARSGAGRAAGRVPASDGAGAPVRPSVAVARSRSRAAVRGSRRQRRRRRRAREHRELELEAQPADPGPVGIDGGETPAGGGQGERDRVGRSAGSPSPAISSSSDGLDRLVEERPDVATAFLEGVEQGDAGRPVTADEVIDERLDDLGVGEAEQVADVRLVDPVGRGRQELVEHRFGVAHARRRRAAR